MILCPYCKKEVGTVGRRLAPHSPILGGAAGLCIGSGEPLEAVRMLNEAHQKTREKTAAIRRR